MPQFDGNVSILSCDSCDSVCAGPDLTGQPIVTSEHYEIQTVINISSIPKPKKCYWPPWVDVQYRRTSDMRPVRQTVRRDNKLPVCQSLPIVSVSNCRSLIPKVNNFVDDMLEREIGVALLSEVWQKANSKKHRSEIEKMLQLHGLKYISTPRLHKRGGGAAIVANLSKFSLEKIDVLINDKLEVVWGLLRPKTPAVTAIREIIVVSFYCPPKSRKKTKLMDHLVTN
jgi:hypothetical protein